MSSEAKKIAIACFIGGALCATVALIFSPNFWWLGVLAGLASGYLSYEFGAVLRVVKTALWHRIQFSFTIMLLEELINNVKNKKSHPLFTFSLVLGITMSIFSTYFDTTNRGYNFFENYDEFIVTFCLFLFMWLIGACIIIISIASVGANSEKKFWQGFISGIDEYEIRNLLYRGYTRAEVNYPNASRWIFKGLGIIMVKVAKFIGYRLWTWLFGSALPAVVCFVANVIWTIFKLIHSDNRVLCAIDGTLGGVISYISLANSAQTIGQQTLVVLFGGLIGAGLGLVNYEVVSKRLLGLDKEESSA